MDFCIFDIETNASAHGAAIPETADERSGIRTPWDKKCALNPRLGRIVAAGKRENGQSAIQCSLDEKNEKEMVREALSWIRPGLVTFCGREFDLPFLHARAAILDVRIPYRVSDYLRKYKTHPHADLSEILLNWQRPEKGDTLHGWCRAFGVNVTDTTTGADVGLMVAAGDTLGISAHLESDLYLTEHLAHHLASCGLIEREHAA